MKLLPFDTSEPTHFVSGNHELELRFKQEQYTIIMIGSK